MPRRYKCLLAMALAVAGLALSACSGTAEAAARPPSPIAAPTDTNLVRSVTDEESELLYRAEMMRIRDCMRQHGFQYFLVARNPVPELRDFPYVLDDVTWAQKYGYGTALRRRADDARRDDPNERYFESLPPAEKVRARLTRNGDADTGDLLVQVPGVQSVTGSSKGCAAAAQRELYQDQPLWFRTRAVNDALTSMRRVAVTADPRFVTAVANWSRCMLHSGYQYATPTDAEASVTRPDATPNEAQPNGQIGPRAAVPEAAGRAETKLAVAEATCAVDTGLADTARELDGHYDEVIRAQHLPDVAARRRLELDALPRARAIVAAG